MQRIAFSLAVISAAFGVAAGQAHAQATRIFVAAQGLDSNPCSFAQPCRTFQHAHDAVAAGGEVVVLDTAGYGALTITKAISITVPSGVYAGITVPSGGTGVTVSAGSNDAVNLRGLIIEGAGIGGTGIGFTSGKTLTVENLVVRNLTSSGIALGPTTSATITLSNTLVDSNGGHGIYVQPSGPVSVRTVFNRVEVYNSGHMGIGLFANDLTGGTLRGFAVDCVSAHNGEAGFYLLGPPGGITSKFRVFRSVATDNNLGILSDGSFATGANLYVSQSNIEDNTDNWFTQNDGHIFSYGDNATDNVPVPGGAIATLPLD